MLERRRRIPSDDLRVGIRFSKPLFFDDGMNMFLAERLPLEEWHLEVLCKWDIPFVVTSGVEVSAPCEEEEIPELESVG